MPNLTNLCTSLELSKRLKELGVPQDSVFFWAECDKYPEGTMMDVLRKGERNTHGPYVSAYTAGELGEMLPRYVIKDGISLELCIIRSSVWRFYYGTPIDFAVEKGVYLTATHEDNEADARAKMLIFLLTSNLITLIK